MKNGSAPTGCSFSCRIRFRIQNWTQMDPKTDFDQLKKKIYIDFTIDIDIASHPARFNIDI